MICILHGYLLDGSGSNLWTRSITEALCRQGETVHLFCQEYHPEQFDFIAEAYFYRLDGSVDTLLKRDVPYRGRCIMHKAEIGDTLPVYVWDHYEEFPNVVPMVELPDEAIEQYLGRNTEALMKVVERYPIKAMHANHAVLMSVVAERVSAETGIPFAVMPHGSAIEYAVKKDGRFLRLAIGAFTAASRVFVIGREMRERVKSVLGAVARVDEKMMELNLGVDTSLFEPVEKELRRANIEKLIELISGAPRGKRPEMSAGMFNRLEAVSDIDLTRDVLASAQGYTAKLPDSDLEAKLAAVDWERDPVMLFVGRLIASKGLQAILAALPLILDRHAEAKLIAVGHGPLREGMEAFLWALRRGDGQLARRIAAWGAGLEGAGVRPFANVMSFFRQLEEQGELGDYFNKARRLMRADTVVFTGYLTHRELRYLFPCADVAIFPSIVAEAGPLVFLEALASGCFPLGTYFAGMGASIDAVAEVLPAEVAELMRISVDDSLAVNHIANNTSASIVLANQYKAELRRLAIGRYEWRSVAKRLSSGLRSM
jgi:glycosyltransferase involved in cell wall biosynthesis